MPVQRPRLIYLVGFMGAGKSSVGVRLAEALRWPFIDLDTAIEAGQALSIRQIFEQAGEPFFRAIERAALTEVIKT
jgi:shikimate kinase